MFEINVVSSGATIPPQSDEHTAEESKDPNEIDELSVEALAKEVLIQSRLS